MRAYFEGHVAALIVQADRNGDRGNMRRIYLTLPKYFARKWLDTVLLDEPERRSVLRSEMMGWLRGLQYLMRRRWRERPLPQLTAGEGIPV